MYRRYYYLRRRKHFLKESKKFKDSHKDYYKKYAKEYNKKHKKEISQQRKKYYLKNRDKILKQKKEYSIRKRKELGIKPYDKWWNNRQDEILKKYYHKFQARELINKFYLLKNRSVPSIQYRAKKLNLRSGLYANSKEKNGMWKKVHKEETKDKIRKEAKKRFENKDERLKIRKEMLKLWQNPNSVYNSNVTREKMGKSRQGEKNPAWLGGISFEPYSSEFNKLFKELIRQRDGFLCLKCGMREEDSFKLFHRKLHIHHIDYDKKLTIKENCCCLCLRCNIEVNKNRVSWTKFFQSLLSEIYGYEYTEKIVEFI